MPPREKEAVDKALSPFPDVVMALVGCGLCFRSMSILLDVEGGKILHVVVTDSPVRVTAESVVAV